MVLDSHSQAILGVPRHGCIWVQKMGAPKLRPWWPKWQSTSRFEVSSILGPTCLPTVMAPPLCLAFAQQVPLKWRGLGVNWVKPHFRRWWDWDFMDPWVRSFGRKWCHAGIAPCIPQTSPSRIEVLPDVPTKFQKPDPSQKSPLYHHSSPNIPLMNHIFLWISQFASWKKTQKGPAQGSMRYAQVAKRSAIGRCDAMLFIPGGVWFQDCRGKAQNQPQFLKVYCGLSK